MAHWMTPPITDRKGRLVVWTGAIGGPPFGYLAHFPQSTAAND